MQNQELTEEVIRAKEEAFKLVKADCNKRIKAKRRKMNKIQKVSRRANRAA